MDKSTKLFRWTRSGWREVENERGRRSVAAVGTKPRTVEYPCARCGRVFAYRKRWTGHQCLADLT